MDHMMTSRAFRLTMAAYPRHRQARNAVSAFQTEVNPQMRIAHRAGGGRFVVLSRMGNNLTISRLQGRNMAIETFVAFLNIRFQNVDSPRFPPAESRRKNRGFNRGPVLLVGEGVVERVQDVFLNGGDGAGARDEVPHSAHDGALE